jgi:hypothetical protein
VSEVYEKIRENCTPRGQFLKRQKFFADTPNTVFSNIGEDEQYRCVNEGYYVKSVSQPDNMP